MLPPFPARRRIDLPDGRHLAVAFRPGAGRPMVLLHGMTDSADSFRLLLPFLEWQSLVMPDLRGHGASPGNGDMSVGAIAADVAAMMAALGLREAVIVGHSLGALTAVRLAGEHPGRVSGLVLLAGALSMPADTLDWLDRTVLALPDPLSPKHPFFRDWHQCEQPVPPAFLQLLARQTACIARRDWLAAIAGLRGLDLSGPASRIHQPVLALSGAADPLFPATNHPALVGAFPQGTGTLLPACGHNPHWDQPAEIARRLIAFADRTA